MTRLPMSGANCAEDVARHAHATPSAAAIRFVDREISWAELHRRARSLAGWLAAHGVARGDRVAVLLTNRPEFVEAVLATSTLGAIAVPLNFRLAPTEVEYALTHSGATLLVTEPALVPLAPESLSQLVCGPAYETALGQDHEPPEVQVDERDVALIMYTSGTTGRPKGAMLTHLNLVMQAVTGIRTTRLYGDDAVVLVDVPLFHIAGVASMLPVLMVGGLIVLRPTAAFDPAALIDTVEREGVTSLFLVPAQWQAVCAQPDVVERTRSLKVVSWGAAPATLTLLEKMVRCFPHAEIVSVFGQTEMSPITTSLPGEDSLRKIGSVGRPIPTIAARVVDEDMNDVPQGTVGEIVYRGPTLMHGYWDDPDATAEAFAGGWFHSGDLVRVDDEGYVYVVDRKKDMIISGGENIYCAEVENVLAAHPAVADVVVIGAASERWGETPVAVLVPADPAAPPTLDDLTAWTRDRLASYKKPTAIVVLDELPRNASGKVQKHLLRARYGAMPG